MELGIREAAIGHRQNDIEINRIPPIQVLFTGNLSETLIREIDVSSTVYRNPLPLGSIARNFRINVLQLFPPSRVDHSILPSNFISSPFFFSCTGATRQPFYSGTRYRY